MLIKRIIKITSEKKYQLNLAFLILGLALLPFLILAIYCHPSADDFWLTNMVIAKGPWQAQLDIRQNWSGRYTSMLLGSFNPLVYRSITLYKVLPIVYLLLLVVCLYWFIAEICRFVLPRKFILVLALLLLVLYLHQMPTVAQTIYWMSGAVTYQSANILLLFLLATLLRYYHPEPGGRSFRRKFSITLLLIATIGCNETSMAMLAFLMIAFVLLTTFRHRQPDYFLLWLLVVTAISCSFVIFAPGNTVRAQEYPLRHDFSYAFVHALLVPVNNILNWLINSPLLLITILFISFAYAVKELPICTIFQKIHPLLAALVLYGCLASGYFVAYWSKHGPAPPRAQDSIYFVFMIGWFVNMLVWVQFLRRKYILPPLPRYAAGMLLFWGVVFLFYSKQSNIRTAYFDLLTGQAAHYHQEMQARYMALKSSSCQVCSIKTVKYRPKTIFFEEVTADTTWENTYYAKYFGKKLLMVSE